MRIWLLLVFMFAVSIVYAQCTVEGAAGSGLAVSRESGEALFEFRVAKETCPDHVRVDGRFRMATHSGITIEMPHARRLRTIDLDGDHDPDAALFGGPAVLSRGDHRVRGTVKVRVNEDRLTILVSFVPEGQTDPIFEFRGRVRRGDIVVVAHH